MSTQNLHAFLEKAQTNDKLRSRLSEAGNPDEVISLGNEWGYDFSQRDIEEATKEKTASGELQQSDLDGVSGGTIISPVTIIAVTIQVCGKAA